MDLKKMKNIYMIGIKGVGMTMLAQFLSSRGFNISGSDTYEKFMTDEVLKKAGIKFIEGFSKDNIPSDTDLIIYSSAYNADTNIEVASVKESFRDSKVMTYAEVLGEFFKQMRGVAVCGSHGKTTVSAWLGFVLWKAGLDPNVLVGSSVPQFDGNTITGNSDYLVVETDEYQNKLQYYNPKIVLLGNIDHDHHDFFPTKTSYIKVFSDFVEKIPKKGFLVANYDDDNVAQIATSKCRGKVISYGIKNDAELMACNVNFKNGKQFFEVKMDGVSLGEFSIGLLGKHNIYNALSVIATCIELDIELNKIRIYLEEFSGTERRMNVMGKFQGATIIDDYAHHPTEIKTTLAGLREANKNKKITVVFHPHTFTRTKSLFNEFAKSFSQSDKIIVLDIYGSAREEHGGVSSKELVEEIKKNEPEKQVLHIPSLKEAEEYLRANTTRDEIVLLMGAGNVFQIGENLTRS